MSAARYRNFMKLIESWPIDASKEGRDVAVVIRQRVVNAFSRGESSQIQDTVKCDSDYESLLKLVNNHYKNVYADSSQERTTGASGMSYEECHKILSNESLDELAEADKGIFTKLKERITGSKSKR